jgi:hypothetical protein
VFLAHMPCSVLSGYQRSGEIITTHIEFEMVSEAITPQYEPSTVLRVIKIVKIQICEFKIVVRYFGKGRLSSLREFLAILSWRVGRQILADVSWTSGG